MKKAVFKFSSVTYAQKAREIVNKMGGKATIQKNLKPKKNEGCGYSLTVAGNIDSIVMAFDLNRIKYIGYEMIG